MLQACKELAKSAFFLLILGVFANCGFISTRDFLDAKFLSGNKSFQIVAPVAMQQGKVYTVTVSAQIGGNTTAKYGGTLNWSVAKGAGVVTQVGAAQFSGGSGTVQIKYTNPAITLAQPELVNFRVTDSADSSWSGTSNAVTMSALIQPNGFLVTAPQFVTAGAAFNVTVTAIGTDSLPNTDFNGTVSLTPQGGGTGNLSPTSMTLSGGTGTQAVTFDQPVGGFTIVARDVNDTAKFGVSNPINILVNDLSLIAVPLSTTQVRLNWSAPIGAFSFDLYRKTGVTSYALVTTIFAPTVFYADAGLTASTQYDYKVDVKDNTGKIIRSGSYSVVTSGCVTPVAASITSSATWTTSGSPYCINASINVQNAGTVLTIQPGVQVIFTGNFSMTITASATLSAVGAPTSPIIFTTNSAGPLGGNWAGLAFTATANGSSVSVTSSGNEAISETIAGGSKIQYVIIEYASKAITTSKGLWIEKSMIRRNSITGTAGAGINATIPASEWLVVENVSFEKNVVANNNSGDIDASGSGSTIVRSSSFLNSSVNGTGSPSGGSISLATDTSTISSNTFYGSTCSWDGGAIFIFGTNEIIKNNLFTNTVSTGGAGRGGALDFSFGTTGVVQNNSFNGSTAGADGGSIYSAGANVQITANTFTGNTSGNAGGAIYHTNGASTNLNISTNAFSGNSAGSNGGVISVNSSGTGTTISGNTITNNFASTGGGAIYVAGGTTGLTISNNFIDSSYTTGASGHGGAIYATGNNPNLLITNNTFQNTYTQGATAFGGAMYINSDASANRNIRYNLFDGSWAKGASAQGGAIYVKTSNTNLQIQHNNFTNTRTLAAGTNMNVLATDQAAASFAMDNGAGITNKRNWWGIDLSAYVACSAVSPASYCNKTGAWDPVINPASSAWNLCSVVSTDPDCVGKP